MLCDVYMEKLSEHCIYMVFLFLALSGRAIWKQFNTHMRTHINQIADSLTDHPIPVHKITKKKKIVFHLHIISTREFI